MAGSDGELLDAVTKRRLIVPESAVPDIPDSKPTARKMREMADRGMGWCEAHSSWEWVGVEDAWRAYRGELG